MSLLFRLIYATHANGTHHKLALDALRHLTTPEAEGWRRVFLKHAELYMEGSKDTLYHAGMRPNSPQFTPNARFNEMKETLKDIPRIPNGPGGPIEEWYAAIKGGPAPGSNFDYATRLTEVVLLGALADGAGSRS